MSINPKNKTLDKEIAILHMANNFLAQGMGLEDYADTFIKDTDSEDTKKLKKVLQDLSKKSRLFDKHITKNIDRAISIFHKLEKEIQQEIRENKPLKRFEKRCVLDENGNLLANGVLLCMCLIREQQHIPNKKIFLQYKIANEVIDVMKTDYSKNYDNAKILAKRYVKELEDDI